MLGATLPLMGILGFWEHNLSVSDTNHELVQIVLLLIIFGWIFLWYSLGEQDRLYQIRSQENKENTLYFQNGSHLYTNPHSVNDYPELFDTLPNERVERLHVKNS